MPSGTHRAFGVSKLGVSPVVKVEYGKLEIRVRRYAIDQVRLEGAEGLRTQTRRRVIERRRIRSPYGGGIEVVGQHRHAGCKHVKVRVVGVPLVRFT